jgi:beta-glucosidase
LFPFGYGLSYTTFSYKNLNVKDQVFAGDTVKVTLNVRNTGKKAGDEVVELYISNLTADVPVPILALKAFKRINLLAGQSKTVTLAIPPEAFSIIDKNLKSVTKPGKFEIFVGGHLPDPKALKPDPGILKKVITLF